jgi:hypothetical protein
MLLGLLIYGCNEVLQDEDLKQVDRAKFEQDFIKEHNLPVGTNFVYDAPSSGIGANPAEAASPSPEL